MRQELATLLVSVQLLKEDSPGRKIAEIQGQLATVLLGPKEAAHAHTCHELWALNESGVGPLGDSWTSLTAHRA